MRLSVVLVVVVLVSACAGSPDAKLDRDIKCAAAADRFMRITGRLAETDLTYTSHFNGELGRCLIQTVRRETGLKNLRDTSTVFDAVEGVEIARFTAAYEDSGNNIWHWGAMVKEANRNNAWFDALMVR